MFSQFGEIANVCIMRDENMVSKQFGFVSFKNAEDSLKALNFYSDKENVEADKKQLFVCQFKSKQQRKIENEKQTF